MTNAGVERYPEALSAPQPGKPGNYVVASTRLQIELPWSRSAPPAIHNGMARPSLALPRHHAILSSASAGDAPAAFLRTGLGGIISRTRPSS